MGNAGARGYDNECDLTEKGKLMRQISGSQSRDCIQKYSRKSSIWNTVYKFNTEQAAYRTQPTSFKKTTKRSYFEVELFLKFGMSKKKGESERKILICAIFTNKYY